MFYADAGAFAVGCASTFFACLVTAFQTDTAFAWAVCYALGAITVLRVGVVCLFGPLSRLIAWSPGAWDSFYARSGLFHVFLVGLWPLAIFAGPRDADAQLFSFGTAICFLVGLIARNFSSAALVRRQLLAATAPMVAALLIPGDIWHAAFAFFFATFCFTLMRISDAMRSNLRQALSAAEENRRLAYTDSVTGLPNRAAMAGATDGIIADGKPFALHFIGLDRFNRLNDSYGHGFGDRVLTEAAARIAAAAGDGGYLARFTGDKFVLIQHDLSSPCRASDMAAAVIQAVGAPMRIDGVSLTLGCSLGTVLFPKDGRTLTELVQRADTALCAAKRIGRRQHAFFDGDMEHREKERVRIEADLHAAIASDQFFLVFQPIVERATHRVTSCEALLRWQHPTRGLLSPAIFLPIAEECGLMKEITDITLREACRAATAWPANVSVAVNLSPSQLERQDIVDTILASADAARLPRNRVEIEITENLFLDEEDSVLDKLMQLRAAGLRFSLDDFGTGYSNLGYISRLPLEKIKIDRSFVVRAMTSDSDRALLQGMIRLIHSLDLKVLVEGIESDEHLQLVMGEELIEELQGFIFGLPLSTEVIAELLQAIDVGARSLESIRQSAADRSLPLR